MDKSNLIKTDSFRAKLGFRFFGRAEIKALKKILRSNEYIAHCTYGYHQGGSGILVATNQRVLLMDKRPFYAHLEDIDYQNIKEVSYKMKLLQAILLIRTNKRTLYFKSVSDARLKNTKKYVDSKLLLNNNFEEAVDTSKYVASKPYLNPGWRPHHAGGVIRRKPSKFYPKATKPQPTVVE